MCFINKFRQRKQREWSIEDHFNKWKYEDDKVLCVYDGNELMEELTFKAYVDRQIASACCACRKNKKFWEDMLATGQVYPLSACCEIEEARANRFSEE